MAELPTINLALYAQSDVGMVRSGNEDNFLILDLSTGKSWTASEEEPQELLTYSQGYYGSLLAVSDGMGGALAGEVASRMAVETVRDRMLQLQAHEYYGKLPFQERLRLSIEQANQLINGESQTNPAHKGLGATFTAVATHNNHIYFAQVGDSRAYLIRQGHISRITKDQSLVQQLIDAGQITEEEAETHSYRNVILQALGAHNNVNVEVNSLSICQLDTLVICSDGLSGKMNQDEIARIVNESSDFKSACQSLITLANERGGEDNITVVIAQFSGSALPHPSGDSVEPQSLARSPDTPIDINWEVGAKTDPLNVVNANAPTAPEGIDISDSLGGQVKSTEPLPKPPAQSMPFTSKLARNSPDAGNKHDLPDRRRGPITSVFSAEELEEEGEAASRQVASHVTTPLENRQTRPIESAPTAPAASDNHVNAKKPPASAIPDKKENKEANKENKKNNSPGTNFFILIGLLLVGVAGLVAGASWYLNNEAQERTAQQEALMKLQIENQNIKEGQIGRLREKIAELSKRVQANDKPSIREKRADWNNSLGKLSLRLNEVDKLSSEELSKISRECDQINKELKKIEDEVNDLQGLLPSQMTNREPVKV